MAFTAAPEHNAPLTPDEAERIILADIELMHPDDRALLDKYSAQLTLKIPFCPWTPNAGPQSSFLLDFDRESLYGGAAGGGKSIALMMAASQFLNIPGYAAILFRKSYADLGKPGALMDIADQWWGPLRGHGVRFDSQQHTYIFNCPRGGRSKIVFASLDNENDRFKYQGGAYHFVGFDELTQQKERDYRYLFSRVRRTAEGPLAGVPIRARSTTNPGGVGHEWVYKRFIARWEKWRNGQLNHRPKRNFHPALLSDNPKLDREDYAASMMELDPVTRAQLLRGDWNIRPDGRMFRSRWFQAIKRNELPGSVKWVRFWDMASTDPAVGRDPDYTVGMLMGRDNVGRIYIADVRRWRKDPGDNDALIRRTVGYDTRAITQLMEQEPGSSGKTAIHHYRLSVFNQMEFVAVPASGKARGRTTTLVGRKTPPAKIMAAGPFASMASAGMVYVVIDGSWDFEAFISELEIFPDGEHDDQVDAAAGAYNWLQLYGHGAPNIGDANDDFYKENEWRPEALPLHLPDEMHGQRISEVRQQESYLSAEAIQADMDRVTAQRFAM